jgi:hypothetical protein
VLDSIAFFLLFSTNAWFCLLLLLDIVDDD